MGKGSSRIGACDRGLVPDDDKCLLRAQRVEHRLIQKTRKELHRLIDQQLNAEESSADRALPPVSELPPSKASGWGRNRSVGSRIRTLLAQKIAGVDGGTTDVSAAALQAIRLTHHSDGDAATKKYEVTMRTAITDSDGKVKVVEEKSGERTRAEIELHLLCESTFQLAAGASRVDEANDILSLTELVPLIGRTKHAAVPDLLSAPLEQAGSTAHSGSAPQIFPEPAPQLFAAKDEKPDVAVPQPASKHRAADDTSISLGEFLSTTTPSSSVPSVPSMPLSPTTAAPASPASSSAVSNAATSALAQQQHCATRQSTASAGNTYSATCTNTNIDVLQQGIIDSHTRLRISTDDYNCAWRCAWAMILTQQQPDALERQLIALLGDDFKAEAAELKHICSAVRNQGLNAILSKGEGGKRLVYADHGTRMETLFNRLTIEILKKTGTSEEDAKTYFLPREKAPAEAIGDLVCTMGASCAVMQYAPNNNSDARSILLRFRNDEKIGVLEAPQGIATDTAKFKDLCAPLPVAIISHDHFDLLMPRAPVS